MAKILVVDDDADCVELLTMYLLHRGHTTVAAKDGAEAISLSSKQPVDLILIDLRMPSTDGIQAIKILRGNAMTAATPIILMSAIDKELAQRRLPSDPGVRFIEKPLDFNVLNALFAELLPTARS